MMTNCEQRLVCLKGSLGKYPHIEKVLIHEADKWLKLRAWSKFARMNGAFYLDVARYLQRRIETHELALLESPTTPETGMGVRAIIDLYEGDRYKI